MQLNEHQLEQIQKLHSNLKQTEMIRKLTNLQQTAQAYKDKHKEYIILYLLPDGTESSDHIPYTEAEVIIKLKALARELNLTFYRKAYAIGLKLNDNIVIKAVKTI